MSITWEQLKKLLLNFSFNHYQFDPRFKQYIWALFCILSKIHSALSLVEKFDWLMSVFICFFGKFLQTVLLKDFIENLFPYKLNLEQFNVKLEKVKQFMKESTKKVNPNGSPLDITSPETYSKL